MTLIIGNILTLIASLTFIYSCTKKEKKKILIIQCIQKGFAAIGNIVLKGYSGAITHTISLISYIFCYNDKLNTVIKTIITIIIVTLSFIFNNLGIIGILPLISALTYLWFMDVKDIIKFKYILLFTIILWAIYDFTIKSYTSFTFGVISIITTIISIIQIKNKNIEK